MSWLIVTATRAKATAQKCATLVTLNFTAQFGTVKHREEQLPLPAEAELRGVNLLVVDDNRTNRGILFNLTTRWGMNRDQQRHCRVGSHQARVRSGHSVPCRAYRL